MDRLPTLIARRARAAAALALLLGWTAGCEDRPARGGGAAPSLERVNAVAARPAAGAANRELCDVRFDAARAPVFQPPALAAPAAAPVQPAPHGAWRWVNVWATWCRPCVEELPLLRRWRDRLAAEGHPMALELLSVDEGDAEVAAFRAQHPDAPASARVATPASLGPWLRTLGLDETAAIPIHILVDPSGRARCVRAGGIGEADYPTVQRLLAG